MLSCKTSVIRSSRDAEVARFEAPNGAIKAGQKNEQNPMLTEAPKVLPGLRQRIVIWAAHDAFPVGAAIRYLRYEFRILVHTGCNCARPTYPCLGTARAHPSIPPVAPRLQQLDCTRRSTRHRLNAPHQGWLSPFEPLHRQGTDRVRLRERTDRSTSGRISRRLKRCGERSSPSPDRIDPRIRPVGMLRWLIGSRLSRPSVHRFSGRAG